MKPKAIYFVHPVNFAGIGSEQWIPLEGRYDESTAEVSSTGVTIVLARGGARVAAWVPLSNVAYIKIDPPEAEPKQVKNGGR